MIGNLEWLGRALDPAATTRRARLLSAMAGCVAYERQLGERLLAGLNRLRGVRLYGRPTMDGRVPTFGFTVPGHAPADVARHLAEHGIFAWSGHFYAVETVAALGLADAGGLVRVGLCHYNTLAEVDRLLDALARLTAPNPATARDPRLILIA